MAHKTIGLFLVVVGVGCATPQSKPVDARVGGLHFIEDDFPAALKLAQQTKRPLFVDTWAPWCHSCLALKEHVFTQGALAKYQDRFVFVAINTELERSAAFLEKYPVENWPTLFVIDATSGAVALKWAGTGTVEQMEKLFLDGQRALANQAPDASAQALAQADRLYGEGKALEAIAAYRAILKDAPSTWERRPRAVESLLYALFANREVRACADLAVAEATGLPKGPSFANAVVWGLTCASVIEGDEAKKKQVTAALEPMAQEALQLDGLLADDRSGLYELLVDVRSEQGDDKGARALAQEWLAFLENEAGKATTAGARASFDPHRVGAAIASGQPLRAVAALELTEKEFPADYNPAARLALLYEAAGRYDEALTAIERAEAKVYGPRSIRIYEIKAGIFAKRGDQRAQRQALEKAVAFAKALPVSQRPDKTVQRLEVELSKLP
ncbi:MAG: thioredoxin family protein [Myxococcaceae bacterium]|nr:thioredoxin family protein [Myxococcaceae bacterium]